MITRRTFTATALSTASLAATGMARADAWPTGTISIVVPFPPGGSVDPLCRIAQPGLQKILGVNVVVENKAGAQGSIGTQYVVRAKPDGGTWVMVFDTHAVNPTLQKLQFDTEKDLDPVLLVGTSPNVLCTHPSQPYKTFADVVAAAKASPGKITFGSIGSGSLGHLAMTLLSKRAGIEVTHVPYKGGGPLMNDALAGHIDLAIGSAALVSQHVLADKLRPLLQTGETRLPNLKDVPTAVESGYPGFESYAWWGLFAPKGTPENLKSQMREAMIATFKEPTNLAQITNNMQIVPKFGGADELGAWVSKQISLWGTVARENNIKAGE